MYLLIMSDKIIIPKNICISNYENYLENVRAAIRK